MGKFFSLLLWSAVFCVALLLIDQLFVHVPMTAPGLKESRRFYLDFRTRITTLRAPPSAPPTIEAIIEENVATPPALAPVEPSLPAAPARVKTVVAKSAPAPAVVPAPVVDPAAAASGYFYADEYGVLFFVDRLDQVPKRYRKEAQPLAN